MRKFTWADLGFAPINGPFSKYMTPQETALLVALIKSVAPKVMIEFGCNAGITAARVLENVPTLQRYIGVDVPFDYAPTLTCQRSEVPINAGAHAADDDRFCLFIGSSLDLAPNDLEPCDAVFIDGDHSETAVLHESRLARELVRPGGIICWHDFTNPAVEVTQALTRLEGEGWAINCVETSWLAFLRL